ncbi:MAG: glutaredoxin [Deltaproteobacteria bacterium]|nr:glutaredoxin [Deltaproteobacteria bacterium]
MKPVLVYTMRRCGYCEMAKRLLKGKGIPFEERLVEDSDTAAWDRLERETGFKTMPQIFIDGKFIGGYTELAELERSGALDSLS